LSIAQLVVWLLAFSNRACVKILHFYIFRSIAFSSLMAVGVFTFVLVAGNAVKDVVQLLAGGFISWSEFFVSLAMLIPYVAVYALPMGILTGILLVLGRLSAQNEITAMRSAGLSLIHIAMPIIAVSLIGVFSSILINNYYAPNAKLAYRQALSDALENNPRERIVPKTFIKDFDGLVLYVGEKEGDTLKDFWIWELDDQRNVRRFARAEKGELLYDDETSQVNLVLTNGFAEFRDPAYPDALDQPMQQQGSFRKLSYPLDMSRLVGRNTFNRRISMLNFNELVKERKRIMRDASISPDERRHQSMKVQMQVQENFSMAFSILSMSLLGIPLGIKISRKETYANFALALGLALSFFLGMIIVSWMEKSPELRPDILIWAPNILFQVLGLGLLWRANRR